MHFYKALQRTKGIQKGLRVQFFNSQYRNSHQPPVLLREVKSHNLTPNEHDGRGSLPSMRENI